MQHPKLKSDRPNVALLALLGVGLIAGAGYAHGVLSQRWGAGEQLDAAAARLDTFPEAIGPWRVDSVLELDADVAEVLQCANSVNRTYVDSRTGERVNLAILAGPPGPISVHTPEICFSSRDYNTDDAAPRKKVRLSDRGDEFWALHFEPKRAGEAPVSVYYAWSDGGPWEASAAPRYEFAGGRYLYKLQLATPSHDRASQATDGTSEDTGERFLRDLLSTDWRPTSKSALP
ncbi:exosortase-associated EpsI family protein [Botrimarina sp.]|uniref:exosortase-associated EpsI family protein n=1 Tax=Botrimarina sp. TaxID=2795802 RepID=UPI0032ECD48D